MKKIFIGLLSAIFMILGLGALSACSGNNNADTNTNTSRKKPVGAFETYTDDIDYRFAVASDYDCPDGNIEEDSPLYSDYDAYKGSTYYIVLDLKFHNFNWADENFEVMAIVDEWQASATLQEANTSNYEEQSMYDFSMITTRYKVPQNRGEERSYRVIYKVVPGTNSGFAVNMQVDGLGLSPTFAVCYDQSYKFTLNEDNRSYTLTSVPDEVGEEFTVPAYYGVCPVTGLGEKVFNGYKRLTNLNSLIIPEGIKTIAYDAIERCGNLTSITLPASLTYVGYNFEYCDKLSEVHISDLAAWCNIEFRSNPLQSAYLYLNGERLETLDIPRGVTELKTGAFSGYDGSITIPDTVTKIGESAFKDCWNIKELEIPASVTSIGDFAFEGCIYLTTVAIPASVSAIGVDAFAGCFRLESFDVDINNKNFSSSDGILYNKNATEIIKVAEAKTEVIIPDSVTSIAEGAITGCKITSLTIPKNVTSIAKFAIVCNDLTEIIFENKSGWKISENSNMSRAKSINVDDPAQNAEFLTKEYCFDYWRRY